MKKIMLLEPILSVIMLVVGPNGALKRIVCEIGSGGEAARNFSEERFAATNRSDVLGLLKEDLGEVPSDWKVM